MALILSLETSATTCSVALHDGLSLLATQEIFEQHAHASRLATLIHEVIITASKNIKKLDAVAVSAGPGSYTGLRIGTSTAKGICYSLNIPLIAINTLELLAFQAKSELPGNNGLLCPMIDAKRSEVYCQVMDARLMPVTSVEAKVIDETSFNELLESSTMFFFGEGASKCKAIIRHPHAVFLDGIFPKASALGIRAAAKFEMKQVENLEDFKPFYVKDFVAKKAQSVFNN